MLDRPRFTPVASLQSNGISEAFVKTIKRGYIRISTRPDAEAALRQIDGWIEDHIEIHPHFALKMAFPRQFIRDKISLPDYPMKWGSTPASLSSILEEILSGRSPVRTNDLIPRDLLADFSLCR
ncbi:transposase InsO family protein [Rhizobium petrolearium]|nr:transposase InsO family protein [Neorhizobium petrolearium]